MEIIKAISGGHMLAMERHYADNGDLDPMSNPHSLSTEEMTEIAECMIGLWWKFKENLNKYGVNSVDLFKEG